jgi:hypothetical protein
MSAGQLHVQREVGRIGFVLPACDLAFCVDLDAGGIFAGFARRAVDATKWWSVSCTRGKIVTRLAHRRESAPNRFIRARRLPMLRGGLARSDNSRCGDMNERELLRLCHQHCDWCVGLEDEEDGMTTGEACASMIADVGEKVIRLGWEDLYRRSRELVRADQIVTEAQMYVPPLASLVDCQAFLAACIARCREVLASAPDDAGQDARPDANSKEAAEANGRKAKALPGRFRMPYMQYKAAEEALGRVGKRVTYGDAYRWLIRYIQAMLGHVKLETTAIYTQVSIRKLKEIHTATHPARAKR